MDRNEGVLARHARCRNALSATAATAIATAALLGAAADAGAKTYTVTTTKADGKGSFKKAIKRANGHEGRDEIGFKRKLEGEIPVGRKTTISGALRIIGNGTDDDLTLAGALNGSLLQFVDATKTSRVAQLRLTRVGLEVRRGRDQRKDSSLQVIDAELSGDNATRGPGVDASQAEITISGSRISEFLRGGVRTYGTLEMDSTTVDRNGGDGVEVEGDGGVITSSTISGNRSYGIVAGYDAVIDVTNSTISGNGDPNEVDAGALFADGGAFKLHSSTIAENVFAGGDGFGNPGSAMSGRYEGSTFTLENTIVANAGRNCSPNADFVLDGGNVLDEANACDGLGPNDVVADAALGPLAENGGPTRTHAIGAGSPAIGAAVRKSPETDQRGVPRDAEPDSGAFELEG